MPELPEMERYKTLLQQKIAGQTVSKVLVNREKSINVPVAQFIQSVANQSIQTIERRAKYLIFRLQNGSSLLLHLMLGGWMFYGMEEEKPNRTVQVQLSFVNDHLYFIGLRLGYIHLLSQEMVKLELEKLGPEPLDPNFTQESFLTMMKDKRGGLKTALINQEFLAGIGNRYSDEILWHAQLHPEKKVNTMEPKQITQLYDSIHFILNRAIESGGYMEHPAFNGDHITGQYHMYVHDREGGACVRCGATIAKEEISGRKSYFCINCQH